VPPACALPERLSPEPQAAARWQQQALQVRASPLPPEEQERLLEALPQPQQELPQVLSPSASAALFRQSLLLSPLQQSVAERALQQSEAALQPEAWEESRPQRDEPPFVE
jgi:hypothetical protein